MDRRRKSNGTGQFSAKSEERPASPEPPAWMEIRPGESTQSWLDRIKQPFLQYQLRQGVTGDIVGVKRHELYAKHAYPVKSEVDVTARRDEDALLAAMTDEELAQLDALRAQVQARLTTTSGDNGHSRQVIHNPVLVSSEKQAIPGITSDNDPLCQLACEAGDPLDDGWNNG